MDITKKLSPNYTEGRQGTTIDRIVIHWIGQGTADSAANWFASTNSQVSAHYIIGNTVVYQCVEEGDTAWHAGNWEMNLRSIGIEHEATPDLAPTEEVYKKSAEMVRSISNRYNIPLDREHIIKHSEVKATQCPGSIDIDKIISIAKSSTTDCQKYKDELAECERTLEEVRNSRDRWKEKWEECSSARADDALTMANKDKQIESLQKTNAELTAQLESMRKTYQTTSEELKSLRDDYRALDEAYAKDRHSWEVKEKEYKDIVTLQDGKIKNLQEELSGNLKSVSRWKLFVALLRG